MKKILIIGATSAIAEATARIWAKKGDEFFLVARNQEHLDVIAKDLKVRGSPFVQHYCMDINHLDLHLSMLDDAFEALEKIDLILIAHGTLSNQKECEQSVDFTMHEIKTNALSVISLLTHLANRLEEQKSGVIAVISSVAGDRGRSSNYIYGSAKAMVTAFTSGLRQRLYKSGVSVLTIKPGFVDSPMTIAFKKNLLWSSPEAIAKRIAITCESKNGEFYFPSYWYPIMLIIKLIPQAIFQRISL